LAAAIVLTTILVRVRFIRHNPILLMAFIGNPGLVGACAAGAFLLRGTKLELPCWIGAMVLMIPSTFLVMLRVPKAIFAELAQNDPPDKPPQRDDVQP
jgi:uncharacterized membrane protein YkvI